MQREAKRGEQEKALACFGAVRQDTEDVLLSFSKGQPNSLQTWLFVMGLLAVARQENKQRAGRHLGQCKLAQKQRHPAMDTGLQPGCQSRSRATFDRASVTNEKSLAQPD